MILNNISKILTFGFFGSLFFERSLWIIYLQGKGFSMAEISIFQIGLNMAMFLAEIPSGIISDKFGRKRAIFLGILCTIIYLIGMLIAENSFAILCIFILYGFGTAMISGTEQSLIYDELLYKRKKKLYHKIIGRYNFIAISALALSSFLGGIIAEYNAWEMIFYLGIISQIVAMGVLFFVVDFYQKHFIHERDESVSTFALLKKVSVGIAPLMFSLALFQGVFSSIILYYQTVLKENDFSLIFISGFYALSFVFSAFSSVLSGFIADFIGEKRSIFISTLLLFCFFGISLIFGGVWVALTFMIMLICYEIIDTSLGVVLNHAISSKERGTILSTVNALCSFIMMISFGVIGLLSNSLAFSHIVFIYGLCCLVLFIVMLSFYYKTLAKA